MRMPLPRWCAGIAAFSLSLVSALYADDAKLAGQGSANTVLQRYGSKSALNRNLSVPMTNSSSQMTTIDGSKGFSAALGIPSSNKFLEVLIQPGATGDLATVIVGQDLDGDGAFDNSIQLGVPVSGVCANGFISCTPGTWDNCQPYAWVSDQDGRLSTPKPVGVTELGGCYCINRSCATGGTSLAWANSSIILKDLGGGVIGSIHAKDATLMITDVRSDPVTITYYGQLVRQAQNAVDKLNSLSTAPAAPQLQSYYSNWPQLAADTGSISLTQAGDPESMYSTMSGVSASSQVATKTCKITRSGALAAATKSFSSTGSRQFCSDESVFGRIKKVSDTQYKLQLLDTGPGGLSGQWHKNCGDQGLDSDSFYTFATVDLPPATSTAQGVLTAAVFSLSGSVASGNGQPGAMAVDGFANGFNATVQGNPPSCFGAGPCVLDLTWSYLFEYKTEEYKEGVDDQCATLAADSTCRLKDETIDGVVTTRNSNSTGLHQFPKCNTYTSQTQQDMTVCRDWWYKNRTYVCTQNPIDLTAAKTRFNKVVSTVNDGGTTLTFTDQRQDASGNWITSGGSITLPGRDNFTDCEPACKVRRQRPQEVGTTGVVSDTRVDTDSYDFYYYACQDEVTCPVSPGDEIVLNCQCINEFAEAATVMQVLRLAGADSICSSGTPVAP